MSKSLRCDTPPPFLPPFESKIWFFFRISQVFSSGHIFQSKKTFLQVGLFSISLLLRYNSKTWIKFLFFEERSTAFFLGILQKLNEEKEVTTYVTNQKLPREIEQVEKELKILESVCNDDNLSRDSVVQISAKVLFLLSLITVQFVAYCQVWNCILMAKVKKYAFPFAML